MKKYFKSYPHNLWGLFALVFTNSFLSLSVNTLVSSLDTPFPSKSSTAIVVWAKIGAPRNNIIERIIFNLYCTSILHTLSENLSDW